MNIDHTTMGGQTGSGDPGHLYGEVIVRLDDSAGGLGGSAEAMASLRAVLGAELVSSTQKWGFELWRFDGVSTDIALAQLHATGVAEYAEYLQPNYVLTARAHHPCEAPPATAMPCGCAPHTAHAVRARAVELPAVRARQR